MSFEDATARMSAEEIKDQVGAMSNDDKLEFYGLFKQATGQTIPASACDQLIENNLQTNQCKEEVDTENVSHSTKERSIANAVSIQLFSTRPLCCRSFTFSSSTQCPSTPTQAQHWHGRH